MARDKVRVGIVGVGNCASSFVQGLSYYAEATANEPPPGLMHVELGGYHVARRRGRLGLRRPRRQGRAAARRGDPRRRRTTPSASPTSAAAACAVQRGPTLDGIGRYIADEIEEAEAPPVDVAGGAARGRHRGPRLLPAGRLAAGDRVLRRAGARGGLRLRQLHPGVHRLGPRLGAALRGARAADRRRRHQEPGRRDDRAPGARQPLPRARRAARPHLPAQLRRQHRLPEHARARAAGLEEDLEDPGGDEPARRAARGARRPRRAERLRAVARRTASGRTSGSRARPSAACR